MLSASSSFHLRKYFSGVPIVPRNPSESLPASTTWTVEKNRSLNSGSWFESNCRMPSPMETQLFLSSMTATAMSFFSGSAQLMSLTVSVTLPASILTGTP